MISLFDFLVLAEDHALDVELLRYLPVEIRADKTRVDCNYEAAERVADMVLRLAWQGSYRLAHKLARVFEENAGLAEEPPDDEPFDYAGCPGLLYDLSLGPPLVPRDLFSLADYPGWKVFADCCELAEWIDCFLATLEHGSSAGLARYCRRDLTGLLVLGDWGEEKDRPVMAAEARHLHQRARWFLQL